MEINDPYISIESICNWDLQIHGRCSILHRVFADWYLPTSRKLATTVQAKLFMCEQVIMAILSTFDMPVDVYI